MKRSELQKLRAEWFQQTKPYALKHWNSFDYSLMSKMMYIYRSGRGRHNAYNDVIIMADTETSKKPDDSGHNHVVAWTVSIRAYNINIVTLWGRRPSHMVQCISKLMEYMPGDTTIVFFHNLSYDWVFLRKFIYAKFGHPVRQLNTKPHYPVSLEFEDGLILRDSLILAQRSLEKWAADLDVEHKKAVGKWEYDKLRTQFEDYTPDELEYIEHDTLAGVECIQATMDALGKNIHSLPYTATGIPREDVRILGKQNRAKNLFERGALSYRQYLKQTRVYHGGFTHNNRHESGWINEGSCKDFASSYPYVLLAYKYPIERFSPLSNKSIDYILKYSADYAFMFKLVLISPRLRDDTIPMPSLQFSKCVKTVNAICDNGRILAADYVEIYLNENDLAVIAEAYEWQNHICTEVEFARKEYLPRWLTDYIYKLFVDKTQLKGGDKVLYNLAKAKLNSVYGLMCQKSIRDNIMEDPETGDYQVEEVDPEEQYDTYLKNRNSILMYQWGVWCTSYAFRNLFELGRCVSDDGTWLYSDTDSCFATQWDEAKVHAYNDNCKALLQANGYGPVVKDGREYWLGVAEDDKDCSEFVSLGAKRYAWRDRQTGELHITVAGVPKSGVKCLKDDIHNFKRGAIFDGKTTGKLTHYYYYVDEIYIDSGGNETGDSVDLEPCNYLLDQSGEVDWMDVLERDIYIQTYEED